MTFAFRPAVRESVGLIIGLAGASGSGKTYSAMRLATGMAGSKRVAVIDTEAGRARHYADRFTFDHGDLKPPFRPSAYTDAIRTADGSGYPVIIVDSFSHEHAGDGGLLDWHEEELTRMAGDDWKKREACKMAAWIRPKIEHKRMLQQLLQVRAHLILCLRAEQKIEMKRGTDGKMEIVPKTVLSGFSDWIPICEKGLLYELTASILLLPDHPGVPHPIKLMEQHRPSFPPNEPITERTGEQLAAWAHGTVKSSDSAVTVSAESTDASQPDLRDQLLARAKELGDALGLKARARAAAWATHVGRYDPMNAPVTLLQNLVDVLSDQAKRARP